MQSAKSKAETEQRKAKLASSYTELLNEFASVDLRHVGNYTVERLIGKGSFGKVYLAKHNLTNGSKVVLKAAKRDDANLAREIHHHRQFIHPHIARLYEVIVTEHQVWLALEYCPGDELYNYLLRTGPLPVETAQKIFTQLVGAVAYIHSPPRNCVHRDLKLENILLDKHDNVKLCDFGFAREYEGKANYLQTFCGTIAYSAPEVLRGERYAAEKVDVWSLGIILYTLLKGELPFDEDDDQATKAKIFKDDPVYPESFPEGAKSLISKLLHKKSLYRPSLAEILADPFLAEHSPRQQEILKLSQPAPFSTPLEKSTLERMKAAGVDIDKVIENVLSQRCDTLAGWWALLLEKEQKKEARRERKRKAKEAEMKLLRRLSAASSRLDKLITTLEDVPENAQGQVSANGSVPRNRSSSRGRTQRRSTPQILVTDLPELPEGSAIVSPGSDTPAPPPPVDKDSVRSRSGSRPPIPPKERKRRSSNLQIMMSNPDLLGPPNGITKRRSGKKNNNQFFKSLSLLKHWFVDTAKHAKSPRKARFATEANDQTTERIKRPSPPGHNREVSGATIATRSSYGATLTPTVTGGPNSIRLDTTRVRPRSSVSPITPRSSYRHHASGLRGRKSTSSSVSSVRSIHNHGRHSKASSISSNSLDTVNSPTRSIGRSPHSSIKVLPVTPTSSTFPSSSRFVRHPPGSMPGLEAFPSSQMTLIHDEVTHPQLGSSVMFAKRKKSPFRGPSISPLLTGTVAPGPGSPALFNRSREGSAGHLNVGLRDVGRRGVKGPNSRRRKSYIIEEEEEDGAAHDDEEIEEVDDFEPVEAGLKRGESVHSILIWDDPPSAGTRQSSISQLPDLPGQKTIELPHHTGTNED